MDKNSQDLQVVKYALTGEIMPDSDQEQIVKDFIDKPLQTSLEISTAALQMGRKEIVGFGGRLIQAAVTGRFKQRFAEEFKTLRDLGKIPSEDVLKSKENFFQSLHDFFDFIDGAPDEKRFVAMKDLFFYYLATDDPSKEEEVFYFMQLVNNLNSSSLSTLSSTFKIFNKTPDAYKVSVQYSRYAWCEEVAKAAGHGLVARVQRDEDLLVKEKLITDADGKRIDSKNFRLTDLGIHLCQFMMEGSRLIQ